MTNLLVLELKPIARKRTKNALSFLDCFNSLVIAFLMIAISNLVSTLLNLFWHFDTFMDKVLFTGKKCPPSFWKGKHFLINCRLNFTGFLWVQHTLTYQGNQIINQNNSDFDMVVFPMSLLLEVDRCVQFMLGSRKTDCSQPSFRIYIASLNVHIESQENWTTGKLTRVEKNRAILRLARVRVPVPTPACFALALIAFPFARVEK